MSNLDNLVKEIDINSDNGNICIGEQVFYSCLEKPKNELIQWLYSVLHVKNVTLFQSLDPRDNNNLVENIIKSVKDPLVKTPLTWFSEGQSKKTLINGVKVDVTNYIRKDVVYLPCFRPNVSPGFFMFNHNARAFKHRTRIVRFYIGSTDPQYAISIWSKGIEKLLEFELDFQAKVLSNDKLYPRTDAVVFYIFKENAELVKNILINLIKNNFQEIPCSEITEKIVYNLSTADDPIILNEAIKQSFGENRCKVIADSIFDYLNKGIDFKLILKQRLVSSGIDPQNLSRNIY